MASVAESENGPYVDSGGRSYGLSSSHPLFCCSSFNLTGDFIDLGGIDDQPDRLELLHHPAQGCPKAIGRFPTLPNGDGDAPASFRVQAVGVADETGQLA